PLHIHIRPLLQIINHSNPWSAPRSLSLHSSLQHKFYQPITSHDLSYSILLLSATASSTSSLLVLSSQLTFSNLLQTHISNASNLSIASFFMTQVSHPYCGPYSATGHTNALTIL